MKPQADGMKETNPFDLLKVVVVCIAIVIIADKFCAALVESQRMAQQNNFSHQTKQLKNEGTNEDQ